MRIHSFIKVCIAALTIAFAVSMGTVPVSAQVQPPVSTSNVTQVRVLCQTNNWCGQYNKVAPARWVSREIDGKVFNYVEVNRNNNTISLSDASRRIDVIFNFDEMRYEYIETTIGPGAINRASATGTITGVYEISADNSPETCTQQTTAPGAKCNCDLRTLRPLQGAVGMEEVRDKAKTIKNKEYKKRLDLAYDPIKIVRGPNGLYVTDHHHGARAWLEENHTMGTCQIQSDTISTDPTQFWVDLIKLKLVRLADKDGRTITEADLPETLRALPDDPYRTLAWRVRKEDGFCRALMKGNKEFAEFQWADWFRTIDALKPAPRPGKNWSDPKRDVAVALAKTVAAKDLPGYHGKSVTPTPCNADPD